MGEPQVDQNQLEQIGAYVKDHIGQWIEEKNIIPFTKAANFGDPRLLERMVAVEQQLKFQNEKIELLIQQSDRRFTDLQLYMEKRFEANEKKLTKLTWIIGVGFSLLTVVMSLYRFLG